MVSDGAVPVSQRSRRIDRILLGTILALDGKGTQVQAVAIGDGKVVAIGARDDVLSLRERATEVSDFGTATVIPGFNDTHAHMDTEGLKLIRPSLADCRSIPDVLAKVDALAKTRPAGAWIVTMPVGVPPYYFGGPKALVEGRMPTRQELDRVAPDHPVCILPPSGYWGSRPCYSALNSLALRLNGIDRASAPRLAGIVILKDEQGDPSGVIEDNNPRESAQLDLLPAVPRFSDEERCEGIRLAIRRYHAQGITSIYEGHGCSPAVIGMYRRLWEAGDLTMRVGMVVNPPWRSAQEADSVMRDWLGYARGRGLGDSRFRIAGVHISYGGDPAAATLSRAQEDDTGYWSHLWQANDPAAFEAMCLAAARHDLRVHTVASAGNQERILPIFARIDAQIPIRSRRWVIEHLSLCRNEDLDTIKRLGLGVTLIPASHMWKNGALYLGLAEAERELVGPVRQMQDRGIPCAAGTDNVPCSALAAMQAMMLRRERTTGTVLGPAACATADIALGAVTYEGAWFTFEEQTKGRLLPGYLADCAVLSANPLEVRPEGLSDISIVATMVGGDFVYES